MRFVGRSALLAQLEGWYAEVAASGSGRMLVVRGRRQVGKSRLLTELLERTGAAHVFFTALKGGSAGQQLEAFQRDAQAADRPVPDVDVLFGSVPGGWPDVLGRVRLAAQRGPLVLVLDEVPWAAEAEPSFEGVLQAVWDRHLQHLPVLCVLVGSDVSVMERLTAHDRPLYGRGREVEVKAFSPAEVAAALGGRRSAVSVFDAFLATGGYPRLVADLGRAGSLRAFVEASFADENSDLVVVAQRSLAAELPPEAQASRVLSAIGGQPMGHASFASTVGRLPESGTTAGTALTRALQLLVEVKGLVAIETPAGAPAGTKLRRYRIVDPYLRFWFRFVEPHLAAIARGRGDLAAASFAVGWEPWRGMTVEPVVREAVDRLAPVLGSPWSEVSRVVGWWARDSRAEVDLVANAARRTVAIGSVKWRERRPVTARELADLAAARAVVPNAGGALLVAVSPAGVARGVTPDLALDASDLLGAWTA